MKLVFHFLLSNAESLCLELRDDQREQRDVRSHPYIVHFPSNINNKFIDSFYDT